MLSSLLRRRQQPPPPPRPHRRAPGSPTTRCSPRLDVVVSPDAAPRSSAVPRRWRARRPAARAARVDRPAGAEGGRRGRAAAAQGGRQALPPGVPPRTPPSPRRTRRRAVPRVVPAPRARLRAPPGDARCGPRRSRARSPPRPRGRRRAPPPPPPQFRAARAMLGAPPLLTHHRAATARAGAARRGAVGGVSTRGWFRSRRSWAPRARGRPPSRRSVSSGGSCRSRRATCMRWGVHGLCCRRTTATPY